MVDDSSEKVDLPPLSRRAFLKGAATYGAAAATLAATGLPQEAVKLVLKEKEPQEPKGVFIIRRDVQDGVEIYQQDISSNEPEKIYSAKSRDVMHIQVSPNGSDIAFFSSTKNEGGGRTRSINILDREKREVTQTIDTDLVTGMSWSSDGKYIIYADRAARDLSPTALHIYSTEQGKVLKTFELEQQIWDVCANPVQPGRIAFMYVDGANISRIQTVDIKNGALVTVDTTRGFGAEWSPDGKKLLVKQMISDMEAQILVRDPVTHAETNAQEYIGNPIWSPDSSSIAFNQNIQPDPALLEGVLESAPNFEGKKELKDALEKDSVTVTKIWSPDSGATKQISDESNIYLPMQWLNNDFLLVADALSETGDGYSIDIQGKNKKKVWTKEANKEVAVREEVVSWIPVSK
jgi:Tol biopolymer transport system component